MAFTANKTALFAVFKASSSVTDSFSSSLSVSISVYNKEQQKYAGSTLSSSLVPKVERNKKWSYIFNLEGT